MFPEAVPPSIVSVPKLLVPENPLPAVRLSLTIVTLLLGSIKKTPEPETVSSVALDDAGR